MARPTSPLSREQMWGGFGETRSSTYWLSLASQYRLEIKAELKLMTKRGNHNKTEFAAMFASSIPASE